MNTNQYGRHGDNFVAHVQKGEMVVPKRILKDRPDLRKEIYKEIEKYGVKGSRYVVGNKSNSINPYTGQPEFFLKQIVKSVKKALPVIGGIAGAYFGGPLGASIGSGLGSFARGDNPANIATNALMGYGLGSLAGGAMTARGVGFGKLGFQPSSTGSMSKVAFDKMLQNQAAAKEAGLLKNIAESAKGMSGFAKGALGLGALAALSGSEDKKDTEQTPFPEPGSKGQLSTAPGNVVYYDTATGKYGSASPTLPQIGTYAQGGFPRKNGQIDGPGTEKSDDIPAMLSDGEFVMTAKAVRGLGALNGANKDDRLEQRRQGAKMMYDMMDKLESRVA